MYVDGFVVPVKRDRVEEYLVMARKMAAIWMKHGALSVVEAMGDDVPEGEVTSFPMAVKLEPDEVAFFSWITYPDRAARDATNAKVIADPDAGFDTPLASDAPMNGKRMIFGGFKTLLHETAGSR